MNNGADKWLTLAEVIRQANLSELEARKIVGQFGNFLAPRNFGDIIKYPPDVAKAIVHISSLYRQGWQTAEIMAALTSIDQRNKESLDRQHPPEGCDLSPAGEDPRGLMMLSSLQLLRKLIANIATLTTKLVAAMAEIKNFQAENQALRTQLAQYQKLQDDQRPIRLHKV